MSWRILIITLLLFSGCIEGKVTLVEPYKSYPPSANVEVLMQKPARPFRTIAIVRAIGTPSSGDAELLAVLQGKAKSVGADAILPLPKEENESNVTINPCAGGVVGGGSEKIPVLKALAIKYE